MYNFKYPSQIGLEITNKCNLKCCHCINSSSTDNDNEMPFEKVKEIIDYMHSHGLVCLDYSGGEPLLHKDLVKMLDYGCKNELNQSIATNGLLLTQGAIDLLNRYHVTVRISYDGYDEPSYSRIRGKGLFAIVLNNIKRAISNGMEITLVTVLHSENVYDTKRYIESVADLGVKKLRLMPFVPIGRGAVSNLCMITPEQWKYILENFQIWGNQFGVMTVVDSPLMSITHGLVCPCVVGKFYLVIKSNGDAIPCPLLDCSLGNIYQNTIDEIWHNSIMKEINDLSVLNKECLDCEYLHACAGGCRGLAYTMKGSYLCKDPLCWLQSQNK